MKYLQFFVFLTFGFTHGFSQNSISIDNYKFTNFESSEFGQDETSIQLLKFFNDYYYPASLQKYKSLFKPHDWIKLSQEEYDKWQNTLKSAKLTPLGWHKFKYKGDEIALIVYELFFEGQYISERLRAQKIFNTWLYYPMNEEDEEFEDIFIHLSLIKPGKINSFFSDSANITSKTFFTNIQKDKTSTYETVVLAQEYLKNGNQMTSILQKYFADFEINAEDFGPVLSLINNGKPYEAIVKIAETNHKMSMVEIANSLSKYLGYNVLIPIRRNDSSDK